MDSIKDAVKAPMDAFKAVNEFNKAAFTAMTSAATEFNGELDAYVSARMTEAAAMNEKTQALVSATADRALKVQREIRDAGLSTMKTVAGLN